MGNQNRIYISNRKVITIKITPPKLIQSYRVIISGNRWAEAGMIRPRLLDYSESTTGGFKSMKNVIFEYQILIEINRESEFLIG